MCDREGLACEPCSGKVPGKVHITITDNESSTAIRVKGPGSCADMSQLGIVFDRLGVEMVACSSMLSTGDCDMTLVVVDRHDSRPLGDCLKQSLKAGLQSALDTCSNPNVHRQQGKGPAPNSDAVQATVMLVNSRTAAVLHDSPSCSCSRQPSFAQDLQDQQLSDLTLHRQQPVTGSVLLEHQDLGMGVTEDTSAGVAGQAGCGVDELESATSPTLAANSALKPILRIDIPSSMPTSLHSSENMLGSSSVPVQHASQHASRPCVFSGFESARAISRSSCDATGYQQQQQALQAHDLAQRLVQLGFQRVSSSQLPCDSSSEDDADAADVSTIPRSSHGVGWQQSNPTSSRRQQAISQSDSSNIVFDRSGNGISNSMWRTVSAAEQQSAAVQGTCWQQGQQSFDDQQQQHTPTNVTVAGSVPASPYIGEKARAAALLSPCLVKNPSAVRRRTPARTPSRIILSPVAPDGSGDPQGQPKLFVSIPKQASEEKRARRSQTFRNAAATPSSTGARQMLQQLAAQDSLDKFTSTVTSPTAEAAVAAAAASKMSFNVAAAAAQLLGKNRDAAAAAIASAIAGDTSPLLHSPSLTAPSSATNSSDLLPSPIAATPRVLPLTPATPVHPVVAAVAAVAFRAAAEAVGEAAAAEVASGHVLEECVEESNMDEDAHDADGTDVEDADDTSSEEWWCGSLTGMVVRDIMTGPIKIVHQDADVAAARQLMVQHNSPGILVDTGTDVPGFLTRRDFFKASITRRGHKKKHPKACVKDIMSYPVIAVDASQPIELCAQLMQEQGIRRAAVHDPAAVDSSNPLAAYVGLVADATIFRHLGLYSEEGTGLEEEEQGLLGLPCGVRLGSAVTKSIDGSAMPTPTSSRAATPQEPVKQRTVTMLQSAATGMQQHTSNLAHMESAATEDSQGYDAVDHPEAHAVAEIPVVQRGSCPVGSSVSSAGSMGTASFGTDAVMPASTGGAGEADTAIQRVVSSSSGRSGEPDALQRYRTAASLWQVDMDEVEMVRKIGEGSFGEVMLASYRGTKVAVKRLRVLDFDDGSCASAANRTGSQAAFQQFFEREIAILASIRHPNVVNFIGACHEPGQRCLVTEYCARGSLDQVLHKSGLALDLQKRVEFAMDVARGMACLHAQRPIIIHRDLKTANLLVSARFEVKVADFGLSRIKDASHLQVSRAGLEGTIEYCAPEVLRGEPFTERCDVYSFGVVLWELLLRQRPYSDHEVPVYLLMVNIGSGALKLPEVPVEVATPGLRKLVSSCLSFGAADRPDFREVLHVLEIEYKALRASNTRAQERHQTAAAAPAAAHPQSADPDCSVQRDLSAPNSSGEQHHASHADPYQWQQQQALAAGLSLLQSSQQSWQQPQLPRHRLSQADSLGSSPGRAPSVLGSAASAAGAGVQFGSVDPQNLHQMLSVPLPQSITPQQHVQAASSIPSSRCSSPRQQTQQQPGAVRVLSAFGTANVYAPQQCYAGAGLSGGGVGGSCSKPPRQKQHLSRARSMPVPQNISWGIAEDEQDEDTDGTDGTGGADLLLFEDSYSSDYGNVHALRCVSAYGQCPPSGQLCMVLDSAANGNSGALPQLPTGQLYLAHPQQQVLLPNGQAVQALQAVPVLITQPGYVQCQPVYQQQQQASTQQQYEDARSQAMPQQDNVAPYQQQQQQPSYVPQSQGSQPLQVTAAQQVSRAVVRSVYSPSPAPAGLSAPPLSSSPSMNLNPLAVMAAAGAAAAARREGAGSGPASPTTAAALNSSGSYNRSIHRRTSSQGGQCPPVHLQFSDVKGTPGLEPHSSVDTTCSTPILGGAVPAGGVTAPLLLQRLDSLHRSGSSSPRTGSGSLHILPAPALHSEGSGQLIGVLVTAGSGPPSLVGSPVGTFLPVASHHRHASSRLAIQGSHEMSQGMLVGSSGNSFSGLTEQEHQQFGNMGGPTPGHAAFLHQAAPHLQAAGRRHSLLRNGSNLRDRNSSPWASFDGDAASQQTQAAGSSPFAAADVQSRHPVISDGGAASAGGCNRQSPFAAVAGSRVVSPFAAVNEGTAQSEMPLCAAASAGVEVAAGCLSTLPSDADQSPAVTAAAGSGGNDTSSMLTTPFAAASVCSPFAVASGLSQHNESAVAGDDNSDTEAVDDTTPRGDDVFISNHDGAVDSGDCKRRTAGADGAAGDAALRSDKATVSPFAQLQQAVTDDTVDGVQ